MFCKGVRGNTIRVRDRVNVRVSVRVRVRVGGSG